MLTNIAKTLLLVLTATLLSCGDDDMTDPDPTPSSDGITRESANTQSATIGAAGGGVSTIASDGTEYHLTIPPAALSSDKLITMTPVIAIQGYPLAAGVAAGVELKPSGTTFTTPVQLQMMSAAMPVNGETPVAIAFHGNPMVFEMVAMTQNSWEFNVSLSHFSGVTLGFATEQELQALQAAQDAE